MSAAVGLVEAKNDGGLTWKDLEDFIWVLFMARVLWIRLSKTIVWMSSVLHRRPISRTTESERGDQTFSPGDDVPGRYLPSALYGQNRKAATQTLGITATLSFLSKRVDFSPFAELTFGVGHRHVAESRSRAELVSQQPDVLREHFSTILQTGVENFIRQRTSGGWGGVTTAAAAERSHPPRRSLDWRVSSPPALSSEVCPGKPQLD